MRVPQQNQTQDGRSRTGHSVGDSPADLPGRPVQEEPAGDRRLQPDPPAVLRLR